MDFARVRSLVELVLERRLSERRARAAVAPELGVMLEAVEGLTRRGGKRLRPMLVFAGHAAVAPIEDEDALADAAAAFELLQTYLLIQDDWMDQDDLRRGGPSAHAALRQRVRPAHRADSLAILASDLACTDAWSLLGAAPFPAARRLEALAAFAALNEEVVLGQALDVLDVAAVEQVHLWKTAGYTVRWPLAIGAILGGATPAQRDALERWARPIGLAFQLRDDVLGVFGDPAATGKPAGSDLVRGKETAVVARARAEPSLWARVSPVFGRALADPAEVARAIEAMRAADLLALLEADIAAKVSEATIALEGAELRAEGRDALAALALAFTARAA